MLKICVLIAIFLVAVGLVAYFLIVTNDEISQNIENLIPDKFQSESKLFPTREECEQETKSNCGSYLCDIPLGDLYALLCRDNYPQKSGWFSSEIYPKRYLVYVNELIIDESERSIESKKGQVDNIVREFEAEVSNYPIEGSYTRLKLKFPISSFAKLMEIKNKLESEKLNIFFVTCEEGQPLCVDYNVETYNMNHPETK